MRTSLYRGFSSKFSPPPPLKIFKFKLEYKNLELDQHFDVKFDGESDGDSPEIQKYNLDLFNLYGRKREKGMSVHVTLLDCEVSLQCSREKF